MNGVIVDSIKRHLDKEIEEYTKLATQAPAVTLERHHYVIGRLTALTETRSKLSSIIRSVSNGGEDEE